MPRPPLPWRVLHPELVAPVRADAESKAVKYAAHIRSLQRSTWGPSRTPRQLARHSEVFTEHQCDAECKWRTTEGDTVTHAL